MNLWPTYDDKKKPVTQLCKIRRIPLAIPLTEARPEAMRIATRFHLRIPHGLNQNFSRTIEVDFRETGPLSALLAVRIRRERSNIAGSIAMTAVDRLPIRLSSHMWFIGEYTMATV